MTRFATTTASFLAMALLMTGCFFTGVENTARVSEKEVERVITEMEMRQPSSSLTTWTDSLPEWRPGKRFFVTDDQVRLLFEPQDAYDLDTLKLGGKVLTFQRLVQSPSLVDSASVDIVLSDGEHLLAYRTGKRLADIPSSFSIPLLVDLDMVDDVSRQIKDRTVYVKTPLWYDLSDRELTPGRQLVAVKILRVEPGNKVLPLRVVFSTVDGRDSAFVWMSQPGIPMTGRDFDALFSLTNPRDNHPQIPDAHWALIQQSQVVMDMNKEECRLALGVPKRTSYVPDQAGMREYWFYDGGAYLYFVDGLLKEYRK